MSKRRLFIAINLPENVKKRLIEWYGKWDFDRQFINWVRKDNLHITLIFLGYVDDDETYKIAKLMKEVAKKHEAFSISLERIITGPPNKAPRMFWVQGEKSQKLADLQNDLNKEIQQLSGEKYNAFRPHITLARFKYQIAKVLPKIDEEFKAEIPIESIELMQSELHRSGPEYTILELVNLGG